MILILIDEIGPHKPCKYCESCRVGQQVSLVVNDNTKISDDM